jgi:hypothetical protein
MTVTINGSAGVTTNSGAVYDSLQRGTAVTASGTSVDFTSIPSWVRRITVMFGGVSTNGTSTVQVQLGAGSFTTSGYNSIGTGITGATVSSVTNFSTGFGVGNEGGSAASSRVGTFVFTNISGSVWTAMFQYGFSDTGRALFGSGNVTLSGTLDRVRITTVNGTDTFDAGTINIIYE